MLAVFAHMRYHRVRRYLVNASYQAQDARHGDNGDYGDKYLNHAVTLPMPP